MNTNRSRPNEEGMMHQWRDRITDRLTYRQINLKHRVAQESNNLHNLLQSTLGVKQTFNRQRKESQSAKILSNGGVV